MPQLEVHYDAERDWLLVEGVKYHGDLFRQLGGILPLHTPFSLYAREDGVLVMIEYFKEPERGRTRDIVSEALSYAKHTLRLLCERPGGVTDEVMCDVLDALSGAEQQWSRERGLPPYES